MAGVAGGRGWVLQGDLQHPRGQLHFERAASGGRRGAHQLRPGTPHGDVHGELAGVVDVVRQVLAGRREDEGGLAAVPGSVWTRQEAGVEAELVRDVQEGCGCQ